MGFQVANRARETSTSTGTGTITLAGAKSAKYVTLNSQIPIGFGFFGCIEHQTLDEWEVGYYELTASTTLERRFVFESSNANAAVNFSAGTKDIFSDVESGWVSACQLHRGERFSRTPPNSTTPTGDISASVTGTGTAATISTTSMHTMTPRMDVLVTTASTTAVAARRMTNNEFFLSNVDYAGGFDLEFISGGATGQATSTKRYYDGLTGSSGAPTDVNPSTLTNCIIFGHDAADTNLQFMCNDGAGTCTKVDLGANFAKQNTDRGKIYRMRLFAFPNATRVGWWIQDMQTLSIASGVATTDLPAVNTLLSRRCVSSVGGTSSVIGVADGGISYQHPIVR